ALIYFLGAEAAFYIGTLSDRIFALFWPPNVVLFCALLIVPQRRWWLYIAAAFPAHVIAEVGVGMPAPQLLVAFATNCMVALLNAYGVRRFVGDPPWFGTFKKASLYIIIAAGVAGRRVRADSRWRGPRQLLDLLGALVLRQLASEPHDRSGLPHLVCERKEMGKMGTLAAAHRAGDLDSASSRHLHHHDTNWRMDHKRLPSPAAFCAAALRVVDRRAVRREGSERR